MIRFLKKYSAFGLGFLLTLALFSIMSYMGLLLIPEDAHIEVSLIFAFWWVVISLPIYKFSYLKKRKKTVLRALSLLALLIITITIDSNWGIPDNPVTINLLIVFWAGVLYLLVPTFLKKYRKILFVVYGLWMVYFTYVRLFSESLETYLENDKGLAFGLLAISVPILIGLWIYEQWKWLKTLQNDKTKAELELLKTQVNPHFFFNTLNNLYSLTVKHSDKAPDVILKLSDMMRYTIYEGKKDIVPLKDEVDYLQNYIDLHKIRYHKSVDIQFDQSINEHDTVAPLLFIILLENALKHGVESLSDSAYVEMNLESKDQEICFTLVNNFDPKEINKEKGIGLENLKRRLDLIYPEKHEFTLSEEENIFKVELKIKTK